MERAIGPGRRINTMPNKNTIKPLLTASDVESINAIINASTLAFRDAIYELNRILSSIRTC
jgi:hypothetical protein